MLTLSATFVSKNKRVSNCGVGCAGDPSRHLTYRPYFQAHPSSSWVGSPGDLSSISKSAGPYSFHPAWMSPDAGGSGSAVSMSRSWTMSGANSGLQHHQQSLHHHHQHQQQQQQQNLLQQPIPHSSALFQPMVSFHVSLALILRILTHFYAAPSPPPHDNQEVLCLPAVLF